MLRARSCVLAPSGQHLVLAPLPVLLGHDNARVIAENVLRAAAFR